MLADSHIYLGSASVHINALFLVVLPFQSFTYLKSAWKSVYALLYAFASGTNCLPIVLLPPYLDLAKALEICDTVPRSDLSQIAASACHIDPSVKGLVIVPQLWQLYWCTACEASWSACRSRAVRLLQLFCCPRTLLADKTSCLGLVLVAKAKMLFEYEYRSSVILLHEVRSWHLSTTNRWRSMCFQERGPTKRAALWLQTFNFHVVLMGRHQKSYFVIFDKHCALLLIGLAWIFSYMKWMHYQSIFLLLNI